MAEMAADALRAGLLDVAPRRERRRSVHAGRGWPVAGRVAGMTDEDLDTVGRSAYPHGLDPKLPRIDIVWWVAKELVWHSAEIWFVAT
jgi:hypothetical protein